MTEKTVRYFHVKAYEYNRVRERQIPVNYLLTFELEHDPVKDTYKILSVKPQ